MRKKTTQFYSEEYLNIKNILFGADIYIAKCEDEISL